VLSLACVATACHLPLATDPQRVPDVIGLEFESPVEERAMRLFFGEIGLRGVDARM